MFTRCSWRLLRSADVFLPPSSVKGTAPVVVLRLDAGKTGLMREESFSVFSSIFHVLSPLQHLCSTRWHRSLGEAAVLPGLRHAAWQSLLQELSENGCTFPLVHTVVFWSFLTGFFFFPFRFVAFRGIFSWKLKLGDAELEYWFTSFGVKIVWLLNMGRNDQ